MTRRDQLIRSWVERTSPAHCWRSCVSYKGKVRSKPTNTKIRKAALDFNRLHTIAILQPKKKPNTTGKEEQLYLADQRKSTP